MTDKIDIGTLDFNVKFQGPTTLVHAVAEANGDRVEGFGIARCRKDDRFDEEVGADLAGWRALQELGKNLEALALSRSQCQKDYDLEPVDVVLILPGIPEPITRKMPRVAAEEVANFSKNILGARVTAE